MVSVLPVINVPVSQIYQYQVHLRAKPFLKKSTKQNLVLIIMTGTLSADVLLIRFHLVVQSLQAEVDLFPAQLSGVHPLVQLLACLLEQLTIF